MTMEDPVKWAPVYGELKSDLQEDHESIHITTTEFLKEGLVLHNALTPQECRAIIRLTETKGYQDAGEYCYMYCDRFNDRYMSDDQELSQFIWERISRHIPINVRAFESDWTLDKLNTRFRFCKYTAGHYFGPHTDGSYAIDSNNRSVLTCMFYLNGTDEFQGGQTDFIDYKKKKLKYSVRPEAGLCVIFPQANLDFYHEGTKVTGGLKYIMRTDIMYQKE